MNATYGMGAEQYRKGIRDFLAEKLPAGWNGIAEIPEPERVEWLEKWRVLLNENALLAPAWPSEYGGSGLSAIEYVVMMEEFTIARAPTGVPTDTLSVNLMGPTLLACGTEEQKQYFLPRILSGEDRWCQGYSEPDAGSDLAALKTSAVRDGDEWVINGQKTWTSHAHLADWIFVLCRTDTQAAKHRGISFLLCPMNQPGIEVRPILNAAGSREFNEVFFTDARTSVDCIVGKLNEGWSVTNELLAFERGGDATTVPLIIRSLFDSLQKTASEMGRLADPLVRQRLAGLYIRTEMLRFDGLATLTSALKGTVLPGAASMSKIRWTELYQEMTLAAMEVLGPHGAAHEGIVTDIGLPPGASTRSDAATWLNHFMCARPASIYSGSNEIQRNILGERILGLPREPKLTS